MFNINLITVGKLKENYLREACAEYTKRLGAYCHIKITELPECRLPDNPSEKVIKSALDTEADAILSAAGSDAVIAMCIEGKMMSSEDLSDRLQKFAVEGKSSVSIVIGSSYGLSDNVKNAAALRLSMSPMTFPHQLARVMLLEQLYRAMSILGNGKYHK